MTVTQRVFTLAMVALGTMMTRFLPFLLFPSARRVPRFVRYLGRVLPGAALGLLVVYCLKDVDFGAGRWHGLPELIAMALTTLMHFWKRSMLLSIAAGTVCYMLLVQIVMI